LRGTGSLAQVQPLHRLSSGYGLQHSHFVHVLQPRRQLTTSGPNILRMYHRNHACIVLLSRETCCLA
jgi:hypothetical protein